MLKVLFSFLLLTLTLSADTALESIYTNVLLDDSQNVLQVAKELEVKINEDSVYEAQNKFKDLIRTWKSVEAFYILGDLDDDYLDTPRYIDTFHQGNEDIKKQLTLIISEKDDLSISLYKNSHKTINALEFILFTQDMSNKRVKEIALIIINNIESNLQSIESGYKLHKNEFISDEKKSNAIMLNALIENSYKLKEWRVGDVAGLSRKFKNKPNNERAEYHISKNSTLAIKAILETHLKVLAPQKFKNFGDMISSYGVNAELQDALHYLHVSINEVDKIHNDDFSQAKELYENLKKLHTTYYISLIGKLKITSKILDSDGD